MKQGQHGQQRLATRRLRAGRVALVAVSAVFAMFALQVEPEPVTAR